MSQEVIFRRGNVGLLATSGDSDNARGITKHIYSGMVVDAIVDHRHPEYSLVDGYNVGDIKVRIFGVNDTLAEELLPWVDPIDSTLQEIPLKGEMVTLIKVYDNNFFYTKKVPVAARLQENALIGINKRLNDKLNKAGGQPSQEESGLEKHKFGNYFKPDSRVRPLKHFEGDTLIESRMGSSIRFGSSARDPKYTGLAPHILLRAGQKKDAENDEVSIESQFGVTLEDINRDPSTIWMVSDENVPFVPNTVELNSFYRSIGENEPQEWPGASITVNSDRVVLNSKKEDILLFSSDKIYLNSFGRTSIDTNENIILTANLNIELKSTGYIENSTDSDFRVMSGNEISLLSVEKNSFVSKKNFIGSMSNYVEPVVGGTSLAIFLARLIEILVGNAPAVLPQIPYQATGAPVPTTIPPPATAPGLSSFAHVITPMGPGLLNPAIQAKLVQLYLELVSPNPGSQAPLPFSGAVFNSYDNYVNLSNEDFEAVIVPNEFDQEPGEPIEIENYEWDLDEDYYGVK